MTHPEIATPILTAHPNTQAIYLCGTWGAEHQHSGTDIDLAVLLPRDAAGKVNRRKWKLLVANVARVAHVDHASLTNLWRADVTFRIEVLRAGRVVYCADEDARTCFEALVLSMYQEMNWQRARTPEAILEQK